MDAEGHPCHDAKGPTAAALHVPASSGDRARNALAASSCADWRRLEAILSCSRATWRRAALGNIQIGAHLHVTLARGRRLLFNSDVPGRFAQLPCALSGIVKNRDRPIEAYLAPSLPHRHATAIREDDAPGLARLP